MFFLWKKLKEKLFKSNESKLLDQVFMSFDTSIQKIKTIHKESKESKDTIETIETLLQGEKNWRKANQVEQLLIPLLNDAELSNTLEQKLIHAKKHLDLGIYKFYTSKSKTKNRTEKQALLTQLIKDLQWRHEVQQVQIAYAKSARIKTGLLFIGSFILFIFPKITQNLLVVQEGTRKYYILTALLSGWMGATFSMLLGLKKRISNSTLADLRIIRRLDFIIVRAIIGMCGGLLLFYFLEAGILSGSFLPDFNTGVSDSKNFALLIIWCFLMGFSEKLLPDLLSKSESLSSGGQVLH